MCKELFNCFPEHKMRIELFFGAGGSYFHTPLPKYSILNDYDDDVTNLYHVVMNNRHEFEYQLTILPITESLIDYWKCNTEIEPIRKALRFIFLSNFTFVGKGDTLRLGLDNSKKTILKNIENTFLRLQNAKITNDDFRNVIGKISFSKKVLPKDKCFVYLDPNYLDRDNNYKLKNWTVKDTEDCFKIMVNCGIKCALSEFHYEPILDFASDYKMNVTTLKTRKNIKNRNTEILVTNYEIQQTKIHFII
ncbi:hypothetical protein GOQ30_11425 [Flavobacterium sp. TP390]|uniref:DNA adenine methylase n=2 Tax=Flavobacterium profundi TaxID=1774945 RepID=A0A6I4ILU7_9FLAO|nr:DNA adenine methylase [Flavobacterium profundi]MVO09769.1 hypothetical protein [Flavobacterium profundi]